MTLEGMARATSRATRSALLAVETFGRARMELPADGAREQPRKRASLLSACAATALDVHDVRVHCDGYAESGAVVVSNHQSWLDPLVLLALHGAVPVAKAEVRRWPIVGQLAEQLGTLFVQRDEVMSGAMVLRGALRALEDGVSVLGFPEGTTTRGDPLPFRRGLFGVAHIARAPVVPVAILVEDALQWVGDDELAPHWMRMCERATNQVYVRIGVPMTAKDPRDTAKAAHGWIAKTLREMRCQRAM